MIQKALVLIALLLFNMSNNIANQSIHNTYTLFSIRTNIIRTIKLNLVKNKKKLRTS